MPLSEKRARIILITGASGQLGRRLVLRFISAGYNVRAHYRSKSKAEKYSPQGATPIIGDLLEPFWLNEATRGCDAVIHAAAMVSLRAGRQEQAYKVNVAGTKAVVAACRENNVTRLIYVSTIVTVGASSDDTPVDENAPFNLNGYGIAYIDTKREAESIALSACRSGLEVIIVNPSIMISPPDREITESNLSKIPRWLPAHFDFGLNLVETDDVVSGILAAIEKGRSGQRYLLTGENIDADLAFKLAAKYLGIKRPLLKLPIWFLTPIAMVMELVAWLQGKNPKFHRGLVKLGRLRFFYSNAKARRELGFNPRPLELTLQSIFEKIPQLRR